ncbi:MULTISPECIES: cation-translocating P-type ATPase [Amycolatopsis]|uniref:Cation-transporting P-type ATPase n=1 Tax=Amycolatopsis dendrobii TaxID=2760662 RepID=A0A7W3ZFY0_9PSEU|nr:MULTISPECIES: cation-transporting P-type ATPase [Amycolatopsis]MBB1159509.1 cation-transporting P-type ATPase [Amycolatopsis dendrobii]UKD57407.1 cation-transporting P-type ATPase [Amycolatopsis sp. FU40]
MTTHLRPPPATAEPDIDAREPIGLLLRDLRSVPGGLTSREAARRLQAYGPNELPHKGGRQWPLALLRQLVHPLALLLWVAAGLAWFAGTTNLAIAIVGVIILNGLLAFFQEQQAERAVEALGKYLPERSAVLRDGLVAHLESAELVRGDIVLLAEGDRVPADARLIEGTVDVDASMLTGESAPVTRTADAADDADRALDSPVLVFSGTVCVAGSARAVVHATGRRTEIGRIASLSARIGREESPLERQVRRVAWLIAGVAVVVGVGFLPLGVAAGLSWSAAFVFAIGLLVANVPEGLLPTITLALAAGVRSMAKAGALVKRLSAVETLGSTTVICTDKTGTLTQNSMRVEELRGPDGAESAHPRETAAVLARCSTADVAGGSGDPTELALLRFADDHGQNVTTSAREAARKALYPFDPRLKRMSTVDLVDGGLVVAVKGAPEQVLPLCSTELGGAELTADRRARLSALVDSMAGRALRVLAVARRDAPAIPGSRAEAEDGLCLLGFVGLVDPPRPEVADAVADCHSAGITVHVVTGDNGLTAAEIARRVGIGADRVVDGAALARMPEPDLDSVLVGGDEVVFSRAAPEDKLRIADALRDCGEVVAMTGDGVNDAPALRRADIGVAMGVGGTDVAKEAATVVLTDDNFATIVAGVREGRRVFDNVRKFVLYIFAHAVPEVLPFLLFAISGGAIPLPLTVLQILAIDLGTETLPALALGREPAEPGLMARRPRSRREGVVTGRMLLRAWGIMGVLSAVLVLGAYFAVLYAAGWHPGADVSDSSPLHHAYLQATTASFAAIVFCQIGTAFAARTERVSLRAIGLGTNKLLLGGIAFELLFAAALIYLPWLQDVFGTAALPAWVYAVLVPMPVLVWGADELFRLLTRRS